MCRSSGRGCAIPSVKGEKGRESKGPRRVERYDEKTIQEREFVPLEPGVRWKCLKKGWCCNQRWRVNLTWDEYDRLKELAIDQYVKDDESGMSHPIMEIDGCCVAWDKETGLCKVWKERPYTCATFPFAFDTEWNVVRSLHCKGFGHGPEVEEEKVRRFLIKWRKKAGMPIPK